ncbi:hypothetical protein BXY58_1397 [Epilithonimonas arachidiradicis]|uniref:Uncharacterized protein n=1 Tax=Epilithonimonas arachidiradicis TaxID=1617282 RepID=A0A420DAJ0_9FLAO|nr:hypothetical protein BXY58_1397 [Epilithonimonas arachidiradicis]
MKSTILMAISKTNCIIFEVLVFRFYLSNKFNKIFVPS